MKKVFDLIELIVDAFFPRSCLACGAAPVGEGKLFCAACEPSIEEVPPLVRLPESWPLSDLTAPLAYGGALAEALIRCKHGGMPSFARPLTRLAAGKAVLPEADLIVPVPLHRRRLAERGFNQAALIAGALSRISGIPWSPSLLRRTRDTGSQGGRTRAGRLECTRGAFAVARGRRRRVAGRRILLVDDVWTTGATCRSCAAALRRAGAAGVRAFALCRVAR
jgi:ComF family protein